MDKKTKKEIEKRIEQLEQAKKFLLKVHLESLGDKEYDSDCDNFFEARVVLSGEIGRLEAILRFFR